MNGNLMLFDNSNELSIEAQLILRIQAMILVASYARPAKRKHVSEKSLSLISKIKHNQRIEFIKYGI